MKDIRLGCGPAAPIPFSPGLFRAAIISVGDPQIQVSFVGELSKMGKRFLTVAVLVAFAAIPTLAHHGFSMFDMDKDLTLVGTVEEYGWDNPHTHILVKVGPDAADKSTVGTWDVEGGSPSIMARQGWNKVSYKPGDPITVVVHPLRNGAKGASLFYAIRPDGTRLYHDIARPKN